MSWESEEITVISPSPLNVTITGNIYIEEGYDLGKSLIEFEANLREYLNSCNGTIIYTRVSACLGSVEGIKDYSNLKVNSGTVNINYDDEKLPIIKAINLSEVV